MKLLLTGIGICCFTSKALSQNVGIGTNSPTQRLHVANGSILLENPVNTSSILSLVSGTGNGLSVEVNSTGSSTIARFRPFQGGGAGGGISINQSSYVGIGLTADLPQYIMHIHSTSPSVPSGVAFTNNSVGANPDNGMKVGLQYPANAADRYGFISLPANLPFNIWQGTQRRLVIGSSGAVGIGMAPYSEIALSVNGYGYFFAKGDQGALVSASDTTLGTTPVGSGFSASKNLASGRNFTNLLVRGDRSQSYLEAIFKNGTPNERSSMLLFDSLGGIGIGSKIFNEQVLDALHVFGRQRIEGNGWVGGQLDLHSQDDDFVNGSIIRFYYSPFQRIFSPLLSNYYFMKLENSDASTNKAGAFTIGSYTGSFGPSSPSEFPAIVYNLNEQVGIRKFPVKSEASTIKVDIEGKTRINGGLQLTGINEAGGRLLVSNASGDATWQNPSRVTLDNPSASGLSNLEFRNNGSYRGGFGWDQSAGRFFFFDGESSTNTMFINNGRIGIQRDPATNALEVNGNASKSSAGDWLANSDARLKKNITSIQNPLEKILQLQGITYEWNDNQTGNNRPAGMHMGFTAQNIQKVFPELVSTDAQGFLQTSYGTYDALYVEAIKELLRKIEVLEEKVKKLGGE